MATASPAVLAAVAEIMEAYRSLPPRPSIEEVEAAGAVIASADAEEKAQLDELARAESRPQVPEELLIVLREVRRNVILLHCDEQRREALRVVELERHFGVFDELIQRASRLISGEERVGEGERLSIGAVGLVEEKGTVGSGRKEERREEKRDLEREVIRDTSLKSVIPQDSGPEKLSLIKVAGIIETSVKNGVKVIDLQGRLMDQVEWLPMSLGKLQDATEMNLSENRIMALPTSIGSLRFLSKLDIHSNQLINLPDSFMELSSLTDLDLHGNQIKSLPANFGNLTSLVSLDLSSNQLTSLPDSLGNLSRLRRLDVETNELEELPYTIGSCSSLVELRLDFNQLRALPEATGKLESLEILTMHYNRVSGLPTTWASLTKLKELDVSFNEVGSIPESLCFATNIVKLNASNNFADLRSLPKSIGNLEMLEDLNISNNQIRILPESFRLLSKLRVLNADENPIEIPPREVIKLGAKAVVQYMADLVEPREPIPQPNDAQSFWSWLCSLCCGNESQTSRANEYN